MSHDTGPCLVGCNPPVARPTWPCSFPSNGCPLSPIGVARSALIIRGPLPSYALAYCTVIILHLTKLRRKALDQALQLEQACPLTWSGDTEVHPIQRRLIDTLGMRWHALATSSRQHSGGDGVDADAQGDNGSAINGPYTKRQAEFLARWIDGNRLAHIHGSDLVPT